MEKNKQQTLGLSDVIRQNELEVDNNMLLVSDHF